MPKNKHERLITPLERRFIVELTKDGNKAAAAERAGCKGSPSTFKKLGMTMFKKQAVREAYEELLGKQLERAVLTRETFINEIQDTIQEARADGKFDAAFKGYAQLGEIMGLLGNGKNKKQKLITDDRNEGALKPEEAFHDGDDDVATSADIEKFLKVWSAGNGNTKAN